MSRIGKKPIEIPKGVSVDVNGSTVKVKGPKGDLSMTLHHQMTVVKEASVLRVVPNIESALVRKFHGLTRSLVNNMVVGVTQNFQKKLVLIGVGYRAAVADKKLNLTIGYSHPVVYPIPAGIAMTVEKQTEITITGANKEQVGQVAADIRSFRRPEPYHGKGIRYSDEVIATKVGKSGGKK
jgi:large subunit ribosomal protein L6